MQIIYFEIKVGVVLLLFSNIKQNHKFFKIFYNFIIKFAYPEVLLCQNTLNDLRLEYITFNNNKNNKSTKYI